MIFTFYSYYFNILSHFRARDPDMGTQSHVFVIFLVMFFSYYFHMFVKTSFSSLSIRTIFTISNVLRTCLHTPVAPAGVLPALSSRLSLPSHHLPGRLCWTMPGAQYHDLTGTAPLPWQASGKKMTRVKQDPAWGNAAFNLCDVKHNNVMQNAGQQDQ